MFNALQVVDWFLVRHRAEMQKDGAIDSMTQMKLHKLLYYAQGVYLSYTEGSKLFGDDILAWTHGPVVREVYDKYNGKREINDDVTQEMIDAYNEVSASNDSGNVLEVVYTTYKDFSAGQLRNMTHDERPWKETPKDSVISTELIKEYFDAEVLV